MANVSIDALQKVRQALNTFAFDSSQSLNDLCQQAIVSSSQCESALDDMGKRVQIQEDLVKRLKLEVQQLREQEESVILEIRNLENEPPKLDRMIVNLERQISAQERQLSALERQLSSAEDPEQKKSIRKAIERVQHDLAMTREQKHDCERRREEVLHKLAVKREELNKITRRLANTMTALQQNERELRRMIIKQQSMKSALSAVKSDVENLIGQAKKMSENQTVSSAISTVDDCIGYLNEYTSVNF